MRRSPSRCARWSGSRHPRSRAFLVPEATLAKRIVRAKRKIVDAGIPYRVPGSEDLRPRLDEVLTVLYVVFNEGHLATGGDAPVRHDLARDAEWLAELLVRLLPDEPEPLGLLALIRLHLARWPARLDAQGRLVLLEHQDRSLWDRRAIAEAVRLIHRAAALRRLGPYQYHLLHATRAVLLRHLGRELEATAADQRALDLTANPAEQALIERRLADDRDGLANAEKMGG